VKFSLVDDLLGRQMAGEVRSPADEHLGLQLVCWGRGVVVYEMPVGPSVCDRLGRVENGVLTALAEAAMTAAARTIVADGDDRPDAMCIRGLTADFWRPVVLADADTLRAEAIVMRRDGAFVSVEADVLCGESRVATFAATCVSESSDVAWPRPDLRTTQRVVA
jgi:acyl-coenzyme A thioesterase PaaI-like protein